MNEVTLQPNRRRERGHHMIQQYDIVELRVALAEWPEGTRARVVAMGPGFLALRRPHDPDDLMVEHRDVTLVRRGDKPCARQTLRAVA